MGNTTYRGYLSEGDTHLKQLNLTGSPFMNHDIKAYLHDVCESCRQILALIF